MQKNWYIIYTKPNREKKVTSLLTRRKIEYFFPLNLKETDSLKKRKVIQEPLFQSHIFVHLLDSEVEKVKSIKGVVSLLYWKGKPAVINKEEIKIIKEFISDYKNIRLEKYRINATEKPFSTGDSNYSLSGNILIIKNSTVKANLPSLGFSIIANVEREKSLIEDELFLEDFLEMRSTKQ